MTNLEFGEKFGRFNIPVYTNQLWYWTAKYYLNQNGTPTGNQNMKDQVTHWDRGNYECLFFQSPLETRLAICLYGEK